MHRLIGSIEIDVSSYLAICREFAANSNNNYPDRGQDDPDYIDTQNFVGKVGEFAVFEYLQRLLEQKGWDITSPDVRILKPREKRWDFDLILTGPKKKYRLAVKTCLQATGKTFPTSWLFQFEDAKGWGRDRNIFDDWEENDYVVFVEQLSETIYAIRCVALLSELHENKVFGLPIKRTLRKYKRAVYAKNKDRPDKGRGLNI